MSSRTCEQHIAQMAPGVQLVVCDYGSDVTVVVLLGEWPEGTQLALTTTAGQRERPRISTSDGKNPVLWCGATAFDMPWEELLKVADFLQLEIPTPEDAAAP